MFPNIRVVFLVGMVFDDRTGIDQKLKIEAFIYGDIIQEAVVESYYYLTIKVGLKGTFWF